MTKENLRHTPHGRIALGCEKFNEAFFEKYKGSAFRPDYFNAIDCAEAIKDYVDREMVIVEMLLEGRPTDRDKRINELREKLVVIERRIAAREAP